MSSLPAAFFAAINFVYASLFGGPMDGTAWDVKVKKEGFFNWTSRNETLVFAAGRAVIAGEVARGYRPALYKASEDEAGTAFSVFLAEDGRDPVEWTGRVEGARITGVVVVRGKDGHILRYVFTGERKAG